MKIDWENIPTIHAPRVSLRPLTDNDAGSLYEIYSDPEVMRYWGGAAMKHPREVKDFLAEVREDLRQRKCMQWGIARRTDNRIIGTFALRICFIASTVCGIIPSSIATTNTAISATLAPRERIFSNAA